MFLYNPSAGGNELKTVKIVAEAKIQKRKSFAENLEGSDLRIVRGGISLRKRL